MEGLNRIIETIRNQQFFDGSTAAGFDGIFEWSFLNKHKCFGKITSITPMDIDGIVERNGRFIIFETKGSTYDDEGKLVPIPIPQGQKITLNALAKTGYFTIVVIRCDVEKKNFTSFQYAFPNDETFTQMKLGKYTSIDIEKMIAEVVERWYKDADNYGKLTIKQAPVAVEKPLTFTDKVLKQFKLKRI